MVIQPWKPAPISSRENITGPFWVRCPSLGQSAVWYQAEGACREGAQAGLFLGLNWWLGAFHYILRIIPSKHVTLNACHLVSLARRGPSLAVLSGWEAVSRGSCRLLQAMWLVFKTVVWAQHTPGVGRFQGVPTQPRTVVRESIFRPSGSVTLSKIEGPGNTPGPRVPCNLSHPMKGRQTTCAGQTTECCPGVEKPSLGCHGDTSKYW